MGNMLQKRSLLLTSIIAVTLITSLFTISENAYATPLPQLEAVSSGNFDSWVLAGTDPVLSADKISAINSDDGDGSYLLRQSDSKRQTFTFNPITISLPDTAIIESVSIHGIAKRVDTLESTLQFSIEKGAKGNNYDDNPGQVIREGVDYQPMTPRVMTTNPFTGVAWTVAEVTTWTMDSGEQLKFGVNNELPNL